MAQKPYAEYASELLEYSKDIDRVDSLVSLQRLRQIQETARVTGSLRWQFEARLFEMGYRFRLGFRDAPGNDYHADDVLRVLTDIADTAKEKGDRIMYLRIQHNLINLYANIFHNYELAFECAWNLREELRGIDPYDFPDKLAIYREIALMYYGFKEYEQAAVFFQAMLEDKQVAIAFKMVQPAYNGLALVCRHQGDLEASDRWLRLILDTPSTGPDSANIASIWEGIAKGNLGYNEFLRKKYDAAIPLLELSYRRMIAHNDPQYASGTTLTLAEIYLTRGILPQARSYLTLSRQLIDRSPDKGRIWNWYYLEGKYRALTGDPRQALLYTDSAMQAKEENERQFSALRLRRAEQRSQQIEEKLRQEELLAEQARSHNYRIIIAIVSVASILLLALLVYATYLYRKRRAAYLELVKKAQRWAKATEISQQQQKPPYALESEEDGAIMNAMQQIMENEKPYLTETLTLDSMADRIGVHKTQLSAIVNRYFGDNFSQYVNEFRVRDAIRTLDANPTEAISIDRLAGTCGFSNRISFYRAFKKVVGVSPTDYRKFHPNTPA